VRSPVDKPPAVRAAVTVTIAARGGLALIGAPGRPVRLAVGRGRIAVAGLERRMAGTAASSCAIES
jgi:hypothetical protein